MSYTIVTTADGTLSCHDLETGEWMHNRAGAFTEALKNYAEPCGALELVENTGHVRLLDACYGLGYNTWVLIDYLLKQSTHPFTMQVVAIEMNPEMLRISPRIFDHPTFYNLKSKTSLSEHNIYYRTLECLCDTKEGVKSELLFTINVANGSRVEMKFFVDDLRRQITQVSGDFDLVFHDAFSGQKMPELWTVDLFREYYRLLKPSKGRALTYSAAAAIRGGFLEAGFQVGRTAALGEKQGGTIASVVQCGEPLSEPERLYLQSRAGIPYRDDGLKQSRAEILRTRQAEQANSARPSGAAIKNSLNRKPKSP